MPEPSTERLRERQIGLYRECAVLALTALLGLGGFLWLIGNPFLDSLLAGAVLGGSVGCLRYLLAVAVGRLQNRLESRSA